MIRVSFRYPQVGHYGYWWISVNAQWSYLHADASNVILALSSSPLFFVVVLAQKTRGHLTRLTLLQRFSVYSGLMLSFRHYSKRMIPTALSVHFFYDDWCWLSSAKSKIIMNLWSQLSRIRVWSSVWNPGCCSIGGVARTYRPLLAITLRNILAKFVSRPSPSLFVPSGSIEHHNRGANLLQNLYRVTLFWEMSEMGMILAMV